MYYGLAQKTYPPTDYNVFQKVFVIQKQNAKISLISQQISKIKVVHIQARILLCPLISRISLEYFR